MQARRVLAVPCLAGFGHGVILMNDDRLCFAASGLPINAGFHGRIAFGVREEIQPDFVFGIRVRGIHGARNRINPVLAMRSRGGSVDPAWLHMGVGTIVGVVTRF
jgi:hypothetical protein